MFYEYDCRKSRIIRWVEGAQRFLPGPCLWKLEVPDARSPGQREETLKAGQSLTSILGIAGLVTALAITSGGAGAEEIAKFSVKDGETIPQSLTGQKGNPDNGRKVAINRKKGNCLACHAMPVPEQPFHGEVGPDLAGVGSRYDEGELRLRIVNPKFANPDSIMPAFYRTDGLYRVLKGFENKTMLTAQEVEDVVAYLVTLKE